MGAGGYAVKARSAVMQRDVRMTLVAVALCLVLAFLLFSVDPFLTPELAVRLVRSSGALRGGTTNEDFVRESLASSGAVMSIGWGADPIENGNYLVYFLFLDARALLRGWFFELVPGRRLIREVKRSHGGVYADAIDAAFSAARIPLPEERLVALRVQRSEAMGQGRTVQDAVNERLRAEGARSSYGWIVSSLSDGRWIAGFLYEPAVPEKSPMRGFVFEVGIDGAIRRLPFDPDHRYESALLLHDADGTPIPERLLREGRLAGAADQRDRIDAFLKETLRYYGNSADDLTARLGRPLSSRTKTQNAGNDASFAPVLVSLSYPGLRAGVFRWPDHEMIAYLDISTADYPLGGSIRVGMDADAIRSALGEPHRIEDNSIVYTDMKNNYDFVFRLDAKRVIRGMELVLYVD